MKLAKSIFDFYLESSIHVSLAVCAFTCVTFYEFELEIQFQLLAFIFFGSITGYNFVKYAGLAGLHHRSLTEHLRTIQIFSLICFFGLLYYTFQMPRIILIVSGVLGLFTLFYVVPLLNNKGLRSFSGLKIIIVAFVWAGATVILPWCIYSDSFPLNIWITFLQRFLWVIVLMIPFEIRDLKYDAPSLATMPQCLGIKKTKVLGGSFLLLIILFEVLKGKSSIWFFLSLIFIIIVTAIFIGYSKKSQKEYYASFWVEAIPIYWVGVIILLKYYLFIS